MIDVVVDDFVTVEIAEDDARVSGERDVAVGRNTTTDSRFPGEYDLAAQCDKTHENQTRNHVDTPCKGASQLYNLKLTGQGLGY
jgi:hypothetical protein